MTNGLDDQLTAPLLEVRGLQTYFFTKRGVGKAVDGVSFTLERGETLGLVGESGSGKSLTALSILRLNPRPESETIGGQILFEGVDLLQVDAETMRGYRGNRLAMVLQDPTTSLNPCFRVGRQVTETLKLQRGLKGPEAKEEAIELLRLLNIPSPERQLKRYPHQLSGGMRQRVVGAIALAGNPDVLIADEPTTALDVTIEAAYLELLLQIQKERDLAILFISHDLGVIGRMCEKVAVMYAGRVVELADTEAVLSSPAHPYTKALLQSVPDIDNVPDRLYSIDGQPPSIYNGTDGCPFAPRCPLVESRCWTQFPEEVELTEGHLVKCWSYLK